MVIGNKESFGVELVISNKQKISDFDKVLIWINNNPIGSIAKHTYLKSFLYQLVRIKNNKDSFNVIDLVKYDVDDENFSFMFSGKSTKYDATLVNFADSFERFNVRVLYYKKEFHFFWKVIINQDVLDKTYFQHEIYRTKVPEQVYIDAVEKFEKLLN